MNLEDIDLGDILNAAMYPILTKLEQTTFKAAYRDKEKQKLATEVMNLQGYKEKYEELVEKYSELSNNYSELAEKYTALKVDQQNLLNQTAGDS